MPLYVEDWDQEYTREEEESGLSTPRESEVLAAKWDSKCDYSGLLRKVTKVVKVVIPDVPRARTAGITGIGLYRHESSPVLYIWEVTRRPSNRCPEPSFTPRSSRVGILEKG